MLSQHYNKTCFTRWKIDRSEILEIETFKTKQQAKSRSANACGRVLFEHDCQPTGNHALKIHFHIGFC